MPTIHIKGPKNEGSGLVSYQPVFSRSQDQRGRGLEVTIRLGRKLRHVKTSPRTSRLATPSSRDSGRGASASPPAEPALRARRHAPPSPAQTPDKPPPLAANTNYFCDDSATTKTAAAAAEGSDESDVEILEVKQIPSVFRPPPPPPRQPAAVPYSLYDTDTADESYDHNSESDLSSVEDAINRETERVTAKAPERAAGAGAALPGGLKLPIQKLMPSLYVPVKAAEGPLPPGYRNIPPNLINAIQRELNVSHGAGDDDDLAVVEKMTFSLKDPITRTKINLPIKATTCRHLECFDFNNFCLFHNIPPGVQHSLKQTLLVQSKESRALETRFLQQQKLIAEGHLSAGTAGLVYPYFSQHGQVFFTQVYNQTPPLYKCPLCDEKFGLRQLYISDLVNYFVKTTPRSIARIELIENSRYKIIEDELAEEASQDREVVSLSGDDSDSDEAPDVKPEPKEPTPEAQNMDATANDSDFNDGLDAVLSSLGDGSWAHPVTLD